MPVSNMDSTFLATPKIPPLISVPPPNTIIPPASSGGFAQMPPVDGGGGLGFGVTTDPRLKADGFGGNIGTWEEHVASPPAPLR